MQTPDGFTFTVYNKQENSIEEVTVNSSDAVSVSNEDNFTVYNFDEVYEGDAIRLNIDNSKINRAAGIVEWELIDAANPPTPPTPDPDNPEYNPSQTGDNLLLIILIVAIVAGIAGSVLLYKKNFKH